MLWLKAADNKARQHLKTRGISTKETESSIPTHMKYRTDYMLRYTDRDASYQASLAEKQRDSRSAVTQRIQFIL